MTRMWIVVGDITSSGGRVITGSPFTDIDGKPVSRITDQATCPKHKGVFHIVDGDVTMIVDGQPVALHGSSLACGCKVLAVQQNHVFVDAGGGEIGAAAVATAATQAATAATATMASSAQYDEAIRFVNATGAALAGVGYTLFLESGKTVAGKTDDDGKTERVVTEYPEKIVKAKLKSEALPCCPRNVERPGQGLETLEFKVDGVITNSNAVGTSIQRVETKDHYRKLTVGEIEMAKLVYGQSVEYDEVKVHNHKFWQTLGLQKKGEAVTPNGEMYFHKEHFKEDFSVEEISDQQWFMHEIAHVWQHQLGYPVKWTRVLNPRMSYDYTLSEGMRLCDYNLEAQGNILADYFVVAFRGAQNEMYERKYVGMPDTLARLEAVLADFLTAPSSKDNLPNTKE